MYRKSLTQNGHENTVIVSDAGADGWEVVEERDSEVVRRAKYTDWHRVERAVMRFLAEAGADDEQPQSTNL